MDQTTKPNLLTARIIAGSFIAGVMSFWIIALVLGSAEARRVEAARPLERLQFWIWLAAALTGLTGTLFFRGRALHLVEGRPPRGGPPATASLARIQLNLVIAWALVEFPALLAGVFVFLLGTGYLLWAAARVFAVGVALTFPRAEWFGVRP